MQLRRKKHGKSTRRIKYLKGRTVEVIDHVYFFNGDLKKHIRTYNKKNSATFWRGKNFKKGKF